MPFYRPEIARDTRGGKVYRYSIFTPDPYRIGKYLRLSPIACNTKKEATLYFQASLVKAEAFNVEVSVRRCQIGASAYRG